jgi:hypothetical protein
VNEVMGIRVTLVAMLMTRLAAGVTFGENTGRAMRCTYRATSQCNT